MRTATITALLIAFLFGVLSAASADPTNPNDPNLGSVIPAVVLSSDTETPGESTMPADVLKADPATTRLLIESLNVAGV